VNQFQELWWEQSRSDHDVLNLLRRNRALGCHQLHYLQMATEKLAKAYFWRSGTSPPRTHAGSVQFMRALGGIQLSQRARVINALGFGTWPEFRTWIRRTVPMIYELERLAPALAQDGPNPEYPWPHTAPADNPVRHQFQLWADLNSTGLGRQLLRVIGLAVDRFPTYG